MAGKMKAPPKSDNAGARTGEEAETLPDSPLLDVSDGAVKKLIRNAKKRGYVTHDQINSVLPSDEVNSEQIEGVLALFNEMGVNLVETEDAEPEEDEREGADPADIRALAKKDHSDDCSSGSPNSCKSCIDRCRGRR